MADVIRQARVLLERQGDVKAATDLLHGVGLAAVHLRQDNPLFNLPRPAGLRGPLDIFKCLPVDRLHQMFVSQCTCI